MQHARVEKAGVRRTSAAAAREQAKTAELWPDKSSGSAFFKLQHDARGESVNASGAEGAAGHAQVKGGKVYGAVGRDADAGR